MKRQLLFLWLAISGTITLAAETRITAYDLKLEVDFKKQRMSGVERIYLEGLAATSSSVSFPAYELKSTQIRLNGKEVRYVQDKGQLTVLMDPPLKSRESAVLEINYEVGPSEGLVFGVNSVHTQYWTCRWMFCHEEPGEKAQLSLQLVVPESMTTIASGLKQKEAVSKGLRYVFWRQEKSYSSYVFGFAAGNFNAVEDRLGIRSLRYYSAEASPDLLRRMFADTPEMVKFYEERGGVPLPVPIYSQLLVKGEAAQEISTFSILGAEEVTPILKDPHEDWLIAHELAHQWWGNSITCRTWSHFWLNEGVVTFMVAAYKEKKWGKEAYDRELDLARKRYQRAKDANFDVPLAFSGHYPSVMIKRAITYSKGALFLDLLRSRLGDVVFWKAFKKYTQTYLWQTVESSNFQRVFEEVSQSNLSPLFNEWVHESSR